MDSKEGRAPKSRCLLTVVLEKMPESPLDCKEIIPFYVKGNKHWILVGRTDAEVEALILCPPDAKSWLIGKDSDAEKDWRWEEKGMTKDEIVGWHHQLYGHEFEQAPGVDDGQGNMVSCSSWNRRVRHDWMTKMKYMTQKILKFCSPYSVCDVLYYISLFGGRNKFAQIACVQ